MSSAPLTATEDLEYTYQVIAVDVDNTNFTYSISNYPEGMVITPTGLVLWTPTEGVLSSGLVTLAVSDGQLIAEENFEIIVEAVNDVPVIVSTASSLGTEDIQYTYQVEVEDSDNDSFIFTLSNAPAGMEVDQNGLVTWTPTEGVLSSGLVTLAVSDGELVAEEDFEITVEAINDAPVIVSNASNAATEDIEYTYQVIVDDPDNDLFFYELIDAPVGMEISATGLITWTATEGILSSGLVVLIVSDGDISIGSENILSDDEQFLITVTSVNDSPVIISTAPTSVYLDEYYYYELEIQDPDDSEFIIELSGEIPEGMIVENGVLSWFPEDVGEYGPITITVSDGGEDSSVSAVETFSISVGYLYTVANYSLSAANNLISFYSIPPEDQSIEFVFDNLGSNITNIFAENALALHLQNGNWVGSLQEIEGDKGYWVRLEESADLTVYGLPTENVEYIVHTGNNLLSYSHDVSQDIDSALPDEIEDHIYAIFGENLAAFNNNGIWLGSMNEFEPGKGYWFIVDEGFIFEYNIPSGSSFTREYTPTVSSEFNYYQSASQAFYFVKDLVLSEGAIDRGDVVLAYNKDTLVGARVWNGEFTDIPVMGHDESDINTSDFCKAGEIPKFVLYKTNSKEYIELNAKGIQPFDHNQVFVVNELSNVMLPFEVSLSDPYPNPFNPSTTISYEVPRGGADINISIYDIRGRLVVELIDEFKQAQSDVYKVTWHAHDISSGMYFVQLRSGSTVQTQKIMLIK